MCTELCQDIRRVNCTCPPLYTGRFCQDQIPQTFCSEFAKHGGRPQSGLYPIQFPDGTASIYCYFDYTDNMAWALITSFSFGNNSLFWKKPFGVDAAMNVENFNFQAYRLSLAQITALQKHSTHTASSCNFHKNQKMQKSLDFLRFNNQVLNLKRGVGECIKVEFVNVRGTGCKLCTAWMTQGKKKFLNLSVYNSKRFDCSLQVPNRVYQERAFGYYEKYNTAFSCTATSHSTTQWWLGVLMS